LLEDHLQKLRDEEGAAEGALLNGDEDDAAAWEGWDVESDSSEEDSDSEPWIDVDSGGENNLDISDSEDEEDAKKKKKKKASAINEDEDAEMEQPPAEEPVADRISTLATTKVPGAMHHTAPC
jgi:protein SDA1